MIAEGLLKIHVTELLREPVMAGMLPWGPQVQWPSKSLLTCRSAHTTQPGCWHLSSNSQGFKSSPPIMNEAEVQTCDSDHPEIVVTFLAVM